jgi:8-oxo-dGTP pyrophosphatase MutT (NUDIX family)
MDRNKPGVAGVIIRNANRVLMCQRSMDSTLPGMWSIPGGHIEENENAVFAAVREFFEETNIKLSEIRELKKDNTKFTTKLSKSLYNDS